MYNKILQYFLQLSDGRRQEQYFDDGNELEKTSFGPIKNVVFTIACWHNSSYIFLLSIELILTVVYLE